MPTAYSQAKPQQHIVLMEAVAFSPITLEVKVGETIVWKNRDPFPHNVTADGGQFHSGDIAPEQTKKITVYKPGRFPYVCTLHPGMKGVLSVK
jgi:plastocyanin